MSQTSRFRAFPGNSAEGRSSERALQRRHGPETPGRRTNSRAAPERWAPSKRERRLVRSALHLAQAALLDSADSYRTGWKRLKGQVQRCVPKEWRRMARKDRARAAAMGRLLQKLYLSEARRAAAKLLKGKTYTHSGERAA